MLTARRVERLTKKGRYSDHGSDGGVRGLYLQVSDNGARSWLLRYQLDHRVRWMGLGSAETFSLKEARDRAREARQLLADDVDPIDTRRAEKAKARAARASVMTFKEAAQAYFEAHQAEWTNRKWTQQFTSTMVQYAYRLSAP